MLRCGMGYLINKDGAPPERCHCDEKYEIDYCKQCHSYNQEYDLIERAIESAKNRIYWTEQNRENSASHQVKAKNQQELMAITIKALEFYRKYAD